MSTISAIGSQPANNASNANTPVAGSGTTTPASYTNPVDTSSNYKLSSTAVRLSTDSGIIATLGGSSSTTPLYTAVGLLNSISQAGADSTDSSTGTGTPATPSAGGSSGTTSSSSASGLYTASGTVAGAASTTNTNWASILAATPQASSTLAADTTNQGIIATL